MSSALKLMKRIIKQRYPAAEWNIYGAQASDGDNWTGDSSNCREIMVNELMPQLQHFAYIEITEQEHQNLWQEYTQVNSAFEETFAMRKIVEPADIFPVFRDLFQRSTS